MSLHHNNNKGNDAMTTTNPTAIRKEKPVLKAREYQMRTRLTPEEREHLERIRKEYGLTVEAISRGLLDQLIALTTIDPSPKLKQLIKLYVTTQDPSLYLQAQDEYSRLFEYDNYQQIEQEVLLGLIPYYPDEQTYKRRTGNDNWQEYQSRLEKCQRYEQLREDNPDLAKTYPTFAAYELTA
jgi:hypothetical protein